MVESIKELRKICHDEKNRDLWYSKYFGKRLSIYITKILLYTPITANHVTLIMLLLGIVGPIFLFNGFFIIGLLLIHLSMFLDFVDGDIARYRKQRKMLGIYIDGVYHVVTNQLMLFGFAYGIYTLYPNKLLIIFGFLSAMFGRSVAVTAIFDSIASMKTRGETTPPIISSASKEEVIEYEGQTREYKNPLLKLYHFLRNIWTFPSNLVMLTLLYVWEIINLKYAFIPNFMASVIFFVVYGSFMTFNQALSFAFHAKKNSIDSFYVFLFGKK